jgi:serine/threonine protein kinase
MGVVYLAEQEQPRRPVALKFLRIEGLNEVEVARFKREAEILGRLSHPGIAHVYGVGLGESDQGALPWIAMEYVPGEPLCEYVSGRALDLSDLVGLFAELCDAVQHAHEKGIVHRDLKPSNILVDERGHVRVLDFGVARLTGIGAEDGVPRTRTGQIVGTLAYASPEQVSGTSDLGLRSDVYSLGVVLHELLTNELPYAIDESRALEAIQTICDEEPRRLRKLRRDAPEDLETILLMALEKEAARRYANAGELAADLRRLLAEKPVAARAPTTLYQVRKFVRRNRALTASTATVMLALLVTVGVLLDTQRRDRRSIERTRSMLDSMAKMVFRLVPEVGFGQDHRGELEALDESLVRGLELEPRDPALRSYRARSLYELGTLDQVNGDLDAASARFEAARSLREGLIADNPSDLESRTHLSQAYAKLGEAAGLREDFAGELDWFQRAFELDQTLVREHPGDGDLLEDLGWSLERMTGLAIRKKDWAEADRYARWRLADATLSWREIQTTGSS